jgi:hypothetical protein
MACQGKDMAEQVPAVSDVLATIERRDWLRLERLLDPGGPLDDGD